RDRVGRQLACLDPARQHTEGVQELVTSAVIKCDQQREARVVAGLARHMLEPAADGQRHAGRAADHAQAHLVLHEFGQLVIDRLLEQPHQRADFVLRAVPVLRRERVQREKAQPGSVCGPHDRAGRFDALAMAGDARQSALRGPASVAVHDHGHVRGYGPRTHVFQQLGLRGDRHQNDMISCSFFFRSSSIFAMNLSVAFWIWSWPRRSSSSVIGAFLSLASALSLSLASRRTLRTETRASSAILWTFLTSPLRRSSVGVGIVSRITLPSLTGWMPRSDFMMAFSISFSCAASHGWIINVRASGTETDDI